MAKRKRVVLAIVGLCRGFSCDLPSGGSEGLVFLAKCLRCNACLATCMECDTIWPDPVSYARNPLGTACAPSGDFCPACGSDEFDRVTATEVRERGLEGIVERYLER
jgi:hypothetical protein